MSAFLFITGLGSQIALSVILFNALSRMVNSGTDLWLFGVIGLIMLGAANVGSIWFWCPYLRSSNE